MKKILCYGDSNTFGFNPTDGSRFPIDSRWTGILSEKIKNYYTILEEGKNNRTGFIDNPEGFEYSAQRHFPKILNKISSEDMLILAIGTNDLQFLFDTTFKEIERGLEHLITLARNKVYNIIIIPPVILDDRILDGYFACQFDKSSISKSKKVGKIYKKIATIYNCAFLDFNEFVKPSDTDGLHYEKESHCIIAEKLYEFIINNF